MSTVNVPQTAHSGPADYPETQRELFHRLRTLDEMIRASENAEDKHRRLAERHRIPPVPDLRFEYSYLRGVAQYVRIEHPQSTRDEKGKERAVEREREGEEQEAAEAVEAARTEVVHVQWARVLWITSRDQIISPFLQGALWGVIGPFLRPLGVMLGMHLSSWWARGATRKDAPEGNGVHWLRSWMGSILTPTAATNISHSR